MTLKQYQDEWDQFHDHHYKTEKMEKEKRDLLLKVAEPYYKNNRILVHSSRFKDGLAVTTDFYEAALKLMKDSEETRLSRGIYKLQGSKLSLIFKILFNRPIHYK